MKQIELFLGRMQPIHIGHKKIIDSMKNPVVVIVKGGKTSEDKARNPLSADYQEKLLKKVSPGVEVSISPNGFLPGILGYFRKQGKEVTKIYAGADRITGYKTAIDTANAKMPEDQRYKVTFQETERVTSASAVRTAIRSGDQETFKKLCPKEIWDEFDTLQKSIKLAESFEYLPFKIWIQEESVPITVTGNVQNKDVPLGKIVKRSKKKTKEIYNAA
jgi:hypothetical protein